MVMSSPNPSKTTNAASALAGWFLTFEGPEGCGKTTQIRILADQLRTLGLDVVTTREPGGTEAGDKIRALMLDPGGTALDARTELFLMLAQRNEHLLRVIRPAQARGAVVLCDRYVDSSLAYQGYGRGLDLSEIRRAHAAWLGDYLPHRTILLDLPPADGLSRALRGGRTTFDRLEAESLAFHERVRAGYLALACEDPGRFRVIDGSGPVEATSRAIREIVLPSMEAAPT
jgi:dTMP kinase